MKAVVRAILTDPEARGAVKLDPAYGKLREPVLYVTGAARGARTRSPTASYFGAAVGGARAEPLLRGIGVQLLPARLRRARHVADRSGVRAAEREHVHQPRQRRQRARVRHHRAARDAIPARRARSPTGPRCRRWRATRPRCIDKLDALLLHGTMPRGDAQRTRHRDQRHVGDRHAHAREDGVLPRRSPRPSTRWSADMDHRPPQLSCAAPPRCAAWPRCALRPHHSRHRARRRRAAGADYKALVCVFLYGGNDGNNTDRSRSTARAMRSTPPCAPRPPASSSRRRRSLPIQPASLGTPFGAASRASHELQTLFDQRKLAVLANVGTLVQPTSKSQYVAGCVPLSLYSHSDQQAQWQSSMSDGAVGHGMGRPHRRQDGRAQRGDGFPGGDVARRHGAVRHRQDARAARDSGVGLVRARGLRQRHRGEQRAPRRAEAVAGARRSSNQFVAAANAIGTQALALSATMSPILAEHNVVGRPDLRAAVQQQHRAGAATRSRRPIEARARHRARAPDLLRLARQLRHAREPGADAGEPARAALARAEGLLRRDRRARRRRAR